MTYTEFEQKLACHCAPALAGIKPANLFSVRTEDSGGLSELVDSYQERFQKRGICFQILCRCSSRTLVMVYRPDILQKDLETAEARALLKQFGYKVGAQGTSLHLPDLLELLARRIEKGGNCGFPHEIGLFLGYPIDDVTGFIQNRGDNYLYSGYWKVYSDVQKAKSQFTRYETVKAGMLRVMGRGKTICQMFGVTPAA